MKNVLLVTYFWPPSGKATVHWPLAMANNLPRSGWNPLVLTADEDTFSQPDESLVSEVDPSMTVVRTPSYDPFSLYRRLLGKDPSEPLIASEAISMNHRGFRHRLAVWLRMNFFVPDARVGWYWSARRGMQGKLRPESIDAIVSIGPPHTAHLVGMTLAKRMSVPHVPVLIDPWVDIAYYRGFRRSALTVAVDNWLEKRVMKNARAMVFVTESMKADYERKYPSLAGKSHVLYWGYSGEKFRSINQRTRTAAKTIVHAGNMFAYQNPVALWKEIQKQVRQGKNIRIEFIGTVAPEVMQSIERFGLTDRTLYSGFLPYAKMLVHLNRATYLVACVTEQRHVPGKLFEYLRSGRPILAFGDGNVEVKRILEETNAGMLLGYEDDVKVFFERVRGFRRDETRIQQYDRREIAKALAALLNSVQDLPK